MRLYAVNLNQEYRICFGSADSEDVLKNLNGRVDNLTTFRTNSSGKHWKGYPAEINWFSTKEEISNGMPKSVLEEFESYVAYETIIINNEE